MPPADRKAASNSSLPNLFTPIRIGSMALRNRLVMSPMENLYGTLEGTPSQRAVDYFVERARGGVGLITLGASSVDARHKELPSGLHFASDDGIEAHRALTDAVHAHGAKIQPQLCHAGPDGIGPEMHQIEALGPSAIQSYLTGTTSRAITSQELEGIVDRFKAAARRAREAGYDGVELHAAHGYMLLGSFLTPWRNARKDELSARSPDGGARAVERVLRGIRSEVGADFPITLRISGFERIAGGRPSFDTQRIAPRLVEAGVDAFHVSGGAIDRLVTQMVNGADAPEALNVAAAEAVRNVVDVPVMVVGRIHDPLRAEQILAEGRADLIVMGRPLLADPELPEKARTGRLAELRRCISCENCIDSMELRAAMDCAVNPRSGREAELRPVRAPRSRRIFVIGGGPAGLEAARVAAERGHRVSLYERSAQLGGALVAASTVHSENQPLLDDLIAAVEAKSEAGAIDLHLDREMNAAEIAGLAPDAVIVATGARIEVPVIEGARQSHVSTGSMWRGLMGGRLDEEAERKLPAWQRRGIRLLGGAAQRFARPATLRRVTRGWLPMGKRIVVIGTDLAAIELAEFLAHRDRSVTVLGESGGIAPEVGPKRRMEHMQSLDRAGVVLNTGVSIERIVDEGVVLRLAWGERCVPADHVLIAGEPVADESLAEALRACGVEVHAVGDCTGFGLLQGALLDGARAGCEV